MSIAIFLAFTGFVLGLSFWLGRKAKTAGGYFAAHGQVGWFVNGIAFAGDYLSAASFLGICGMIAFYGYDGFLYSIGFLAGWVVALFVIAEPIKKLGKYTFADALDAKFNSRGIKLAAAVSTLLVSIFYLIPQMVGAGALVTPLLGLKPMIWHGLDLAHAIGVSIVGTIVILIVVTAGMVSTTWVQFIKGSLLVVFCAVLVGMILNRGLKEDNRYDEIVSFTVPSPTTQGAAVAIEGVKLSIPPSGQNVPAGKNSPPILTQVAGSEGASSPTGFLSAFASATFVQLPGPTDASGASQSIAQPTTLSGNSLLLPGGYFKGIRSPNLTDRLDFVSLMLALFAGTASLPHILIRYYTVKDARAARLSTVVGIGAIGFFYVLTLYIGLGAMVSGNLDPTDSNKAAPLLAKSFNETMFAIISAIAFTTVLGTVSGLILASAGAVAHDLYGLLRSSSRALADGETAAANAEAKGRRQVRIAKIASIVVGIIAMILGILFKGLNVGFLVGWAFNVAASANLPAIVMLLFWKHTTRQGIIASILVGLFSSLIWLALTKEAFVNVYGIVGSTGIMPMSQPALVTIPLSFLTLVVVSLMTKGSTRRGFDVAAAR